jgi:hypothetical protein
MVYVSASSGAIPTVRLKASCTPNQIETGPKNKLMDCLHTHTLPSLRGAIKLSISRTWVSFSSLEHHRLRSEAS